jgi:hypothetical protein
MGHSFERIAIAAAQVDADFFLALVFEVVEQVLHPVAFCKKKKGSATFQFHPAPKAVCEGVFFFQVEIGFWQGGPAWGANVFSVRRGVAVAGKAQVRVEQVEQILEGLQQFSHQ